jgi:hypothetical protein
MGTFIVYSLLKVLAASGGRSLMYYSGITSLLPSYRASLGFLYVTVKNNQHFINCGEVALPVWFRKRKF